MVGRCWETPIEDSYTDFSPDCQMLLRDITAKAGFLQAGYSVDYFRFSKGLYAVMPPCVIGRIWWDYWQVWNARLLGADVKDVSSQVLAIHQNHNCGYHAQGTKGVWNDEQALANCRNAGGRGHLYTIDDAMHIRNPQDEHSNLWRYFAAYWRFLRPKVIPVQYGFLNVRRPVRHFLGLRQKPKPRPVCQAIAEKTHL